jgi:hypothetical protein
MYDCERCGASFSPLRIASPDTCPRCFVREGVRTQLSYSLFGKGKSDLTREPQGPPASAPESGSSGMELQTLADEVG